MTASAYRLVGAALVSVLLFACAEPEPDHAAVAGADVGTRRPACHAAQRRPDGRCCDGAGQFYQPESATCVAIGPPECAGDLLTDSARCVPIWCWQWLDGAGAACEPGDSGCAAVGRDCTAADAAAGLGCPAGEFSVTGLRTDCRPAGAVHLPGGVLLPADVTPPALAAVVGMSDTPSGCPLGFLPEDVATRTPGVLPACLPDPGDCGTDAFGGHDDAPTVAFVDPAYEGASKGSRAQPFKSLGAALSAADGGWTLVLAAGSYTHSSAIAKSVTIAGRCAALVQIGPLSFQLGEATEVARVARVAARRVTATRGRVELERVHVTARPELHGVLAEGQDASVVATNLVVDDRVPADTEPKPWAPGLAATGVSVRGGASLQLTDARLPCRLRTGIYVHGASSLTARRVLVAGTAVGGAPTAPMTAVLSQGAAAVELTDVRISDCGADGIGAVAGTTLEAQDLVVDAGPAPLAGHWGAVGVLGSSSASLRQLRVQGFGTGVVALQGASLVVTDLLVGHAPDALVSLDGEAEVGAAVGANGSGKVTVVHGRIVAPVGGGLVARGESGGKADLVATDVRVEHTRAAQDGTAWWPAVYCEACSRLRIAGAAMHGNVGAGIETFGGPLVAYGVRVTGTATTAVAGASGFGAVAVAGSLELRAAVLDDNHGAGLGILSGTLVADRVVVRRTQGADTLDGILLADGLAAAYGAKVTIRRSLLADCARAGLLADSSQVTAEGVLIADNHFGVVAQHGATTALTALATVGNVTAFALEQGLALPEIPGLAPTGP